MSAIFEILHEIRGEEALPDSAFAVDDEVDLFRVKPLQRRILMIAVDRAVKRVRDL